MRGRTPFVVANRAPVPPLQATFWCAHASETIDLLAFHLANLPADSETARAIANPAMWGDTRDHVLDDLQVQATNPPVQRSMELLLVTLAALPRASVGPSADQTSAVPLGVLARSERLANLLQGDWGGVISAWDRSVYDAGAVPVEVTARRGGRVGAGAVARRGGRVGRGAVTRAQSRGRAVGRGGRTTQARGGSPTAEQQQSPRELTEEERARIANNRAAALIRRARNGPALGVGPSGRVRSPPSATAVQERQAAIQRRLEADRQGMLHQLAAEGSLAALEAENAQGIEEAFLRLPEAVRLAILTSCNRITVALPLAESMMAGCASCGDPYVEAEHVIMTPCIHALHTRCFVAWAGASFERAVSMCMPWRLQCPHCREPLG